MNLIKIKATKNDQNRTLFKVLSKYFSNVPISRLEKLFRKKDIKVNGNRKIDKSYLVVENDLIEIYGLENVTDHQKENEFKTSEVKFSPIYEDDNILIINKPINVAMHSEEDCLDFQVLKYLKFNKSDSFIPSHLGRLDKETSGLVVYAKNFETLKTFKENPDLIQKTYWFKSDFEGPNTLVKGYIYKNEDKKKMSYSPTQKPNSQYFETNLFIENRKKFATITTGRKHQIRLSLTAIGKPIYGDRKYGGKKADRLMLHAYILKFNKLPKKLSYLSNKEFIANVKW
ncbi:RluA family pseudouridine synthase [Mycoplasmopsis ciconiae]|uniref:RNA pseudouridylate synthase n=1 Tax=Mycoplasmopsis ciconiae TaxID=561067 RepID=A0ABU7MLN5_9BACT|nr:RluA family pseudouridine synthase [Mycoplasmopsis ciconiae]